MSQPEFRLSVSQPLSLKIISSAIPPPGNDNLLKAIEFRLEDLFRTFRVRPLDLTFDPREGYQLVAGPYIGVIDFGAFRLELTPKIPGLSVGKCLLLAHRSNSGFLTRHLNDLVDREISVKDAMQESEYFATCFISAVADVVRNGLLTSFDAVNKLSPDLRGSIQPSKHIESGQPHTQPICRLPISNPDIGANQILLAAIQLCLGRIINPKIKAIANSLLPHFKGVRSSYEQRDFELRLSIPRDDYERAIALAQIILEGFDPSGGGESRFFPSFALNLDELFEVYVAWEIKRVLRAGDIKLWTQRPAKHPCKPSLANKTYVPDIVLSKGDAHPSIVIDTKNKYSQILADGGVDISNADLFQIFYYSHATNAMVGILVYPGNNKNATRYPIKGSEGTPAYEAKRQKAFKQLLASGMISLFPGQEKVCKRIIRWFINMTGTLDETERSIAELTQFSVHMLKGKL